MFVVVGGGVAGVCCVQEMLEQLDDGPGASTDDNGTATPRVAFVCGRAGFIKTVNKVEKIGELAETVSIQESSPESFFSSDKVAVIQQDVVNWHADEKRLDLSDGNSIVYDKLCIATGAKPITTFANRHVLTLRDMDTIEMLKSHLVDCRRVLIVGNGGIACELAFELRDTEIVWAIRHSDIGASYFDKNASAIFYPRFLSGRDQGCVKNEVKRDRYVVSDNNNTKNASSATSTTGCALGPHWLAKLHQTDDSSRPEQNARRVHLIREVEVQRIDEEPPTVSSSKTELPSSTAPLPSDFHPDDPERPWNVYVTLTNGQVVGADVVVLGLGVQPNSELWSRACDRLTLAPDGGIRVNEHMATSVPDVFAAGDVCTTSFRAPHWLQLRLWTQARAMGIYCARCMVLEEVEPDICFELFTHVTSFFGYEVILLGDFAGEHLATPYDVDVRSTPGHDYIKVLIKDDRVQGAVLVGDVSHAETFQNLILNQTNVSSVGTDLLNPEFDLDDYYD